MKLEIRGRDLPLWLWAAGYLEFLWHTAGPGGFPVGTFTVPMACVLVLLSLRARGRAWALEALQLGREWRELPRSGNSLPFVAYGACFLLLGASLALGLFSALRPPFLPQEQDAVMYQMGVPRQLLIQGTIGWIGWSMPDLWPMAMQWGMAPLSFAFGTINKIPQFICTLGVGACLYRIAGQAFPERGSRLFLTLPALAFLGAHGVVIQVGSGMMDLPAVYFLLACVSALFDRRLTVAALAASVYVATKATHPIQVGAITVAAGIWLRLSGRGLETLLTRFLPLLCIFSLLLLARPVILSLKETGTPLFPFAVCGTSHGELCEPGKEANLRFAEKEILGARDWYGNGRGALAFLRHLWTVAVPTKGVNNEFDYPLGLPWLILMVLVAFSLVAGRWRNPMLLLALAFWALWWPNAQQARWLYPTLAFGFLGTLEVQWRARNLLPQLLAASLAFSLISQFRSIQPTLGLSIATIREREEAKVRWSPDGKLETVELLYVGKPAPEHTPLKSVWVLK